MNMYIVPSDPHCWYSYASIPETINAPEKMDLQAMVKADADRYTRSFEMMTKFEEE